MRETIRRIAVGLLAVALFFGIMSVSAFAAEEGEMTGTFGENNGFRWSYEETTKTLTVTGDDSGLNNMQNSLPDSVLNNMENIVFKDCKASGSLSRLLRALKNITSVKFDNFDTKNVTDMSYMFIGCSSLTDVNLSGFDTSNVTDMNCMFYRCSSLTGLDVSGFDTGNVTDMNFMFFCCSSLMDLDVSGFDTTNVTDMCLILGGE